MRDLFGLEQQQPRALDRNEAVSLWEVLTAVPVAWRVDHRPRVADCTWLRQSERCLAVPSGGVRGANQPLVLVRSARWQHIAVRPLQEPR